MATHILLVSDNQARVRHRWVQGE